MNDSDDFWGDVPDWDDRPRRSRRSGPRGSSTSQDGDGIGATLRRWWDRALSGDTDGTRSHGIPRPDLGDVHDEPESEHETADVRRAAVRSQHDAPERPDHPPHDDDRPHHELDAAFAVAEPETRSGGIDPLVLRIGAIVVTLTLLLPFVIGADDSTDTITGAPPSDASAADTSTMPLTPSTPTDPDTGGTPPPASGTLLDPATLPPATPVGGAGGETATPDRDTNSAVSPDTSPDADTTPTTNDGDDPVTTDDPASGDSGETGGDSGDTGEAESGDTGEAGDSPDGNGTSTGAVTGSAIADEVANREARDCAIEYEVVAGDFWLRLAEEAGVPLTDLLDSNAATTATPLFPGSTICLPAGARTPNPPDDVTTTTAAPTTTTTTTTTTTLPAPDVPETAEEIQQLIREIWPDDLEDRAIEIAFRESRFDPRARNFCCYGIFQIYWSVHRSWLADLGVTSDQQLYDPETNISAALVLYERAGGWGPWGF